MKIKKLISLRLLVAAAAVAGTTEWVLRDETFGEDDEASAYAGPRAGARRKKFSFVETKRAEQVVPTPRLPVPYVEPTRNDADGGRRPIWSMDRDFTAPTSPAPAERFSYVAADMVSGSAKVLSVSVNTGGAETAVRRHSENFTVPVTRAPSVGMIFAVKPTKKSSKPDLSTTDPETSDSSTSTLVAASTRPAAFTRTNPSVHNAGLDVYPGPTEAFLPGSDPPGGGSNPLVTPPVNTSGVFAQSVTNPLTVDSRQRVSRFLLIYARDLQGQDMNTASSGGAYGTSTRYEYLQKVALDEREWFAKNSGGLMEGQFTIIDSGALGYKSGTTPYASPFEIIDAALAANNLTRADFDYIQVFAGDVANSPYIDHLSGAAGQGNVGNGTGTNTQWFFSSAEHHELGHNIGLNHAHDLNDTSTGASLYKYNFTTGQYETSTSSSNRTGVQLHQLSIGLIQNDYGNPIDVMATAASNREYGPRDKAIAGWLSAANSQFKTITPGTNGATQTVSIHDPSELVSVINGQTGSNLRYGVAAGYANVPYSATFTRKAQQFIPNSTNDGGKWVSVVQVVDLNYVQLTSSTYGIEVRIDGQYYGILQLGQTINDIDFGKYLYIQAVSPFGNSTTYDLIDDLHAGAPDNPTRYSSSSYTLEYASNGTDTTTYGNSLTSSFGTLNIITHLGSTPTGLRYNTAPGNVWSVASGWTDIDNANAAASWADGRHAVFGATGLAAGTVTVSGTVTPLSLTFKPTGGGSYLLTGGTVNLGAGGVNAEASAEIASALTLSDRQAWEILGGNTVTLSGTVNTGTNRFDVMGQGTLALSGSGTYDEVHAYETSIIQSASQSIKELNLHGSSSYRVDSGTLTFSTSGTGNGTNKDAGFGGKLILNTGTASTSAAPDVVVRNNTLGADIQLNSGLHYFGTASSFTSTVTGDITGSGGLAYSASSDSVNLTLSGDNTFTGDILLNRGVLAMGNFGTLSGSNILRFDVASGQSAEFRTGMRSHTVRNLSSTGAGSSFVSNNSAYDATLTVQEDADTTFGGVMRNGSTGLLSLTKTGTSTLTLTGANTYTGTTTISSGTLQIGSGSTTGSIGTGAIVDNGTLRINRSNALTLANVISGTGAFVNAGTGTTTLSGASTYTGATQVNAGVLAVTGSLGNTAVSVASGATLTGTGSIAGGVNIAAGGILSGTQSGTLTMGALTLASTSQVNVTLDNPSATPLFAVNGALTLDGLLNVSTTTTLWEGVYRIFNYTGALNDQGLLVGTAPVSTANLAVQTSVSGQVNLVNTNSSGFNFWDGPGTANNGAINGGSGTWSASVSNWTSSTGSTNGAYSPNPTFAIFEAGSGTVTVDNTGGTIQSTGMQFAVSGYTVSGDSITLVNGSSGSAQMRVGDGTSAGASMSATIGSVLTGSANLNKTDLGTLTLTGANTYTGGTTITAGTLRLGGAGTLGNGVYAGAVQDDGVFDFASSATQRITGSFAGAGALIVSGSGVLDLGGGTTFSGSVNINAGTLKLSGAAGTGLDVINVNSGGTLLVAADQPGSSNRGKRIVVTGNGAGATTGLYLDGSTVLSGDSGIVLTGNATTIRHSGAGTARLGSSQGDNLIVEAAASGSVVDSNINIGGTSGFSNTFGFTFNVTSGTNTTTGDLRVDGQILQVNSSSSDENMTVKGTGSVNFTAASDTYVSKKLTVQNTATMMFTGSASLGAGAYSGAVSVASGADFIWNTTTNQTFSGVISGSGSFTKNGSGTLTLTAANTLNNSSDTANSGFTAAGGVLALDFSASGAAATNIIASGSVLHLTGGTVRITGTTGQNGVIQTFAGLDVRSGASVLELVQNGATLMDVNVGAITFAGGTVRFAGANDASVTATGAHFRTSTDAGANNGLTLLDATSALWGATGSQFASVKTVGGVKYIVAWEGDYYDVRTGTDVGGTVIIPNDAAKTVRILEGGSTGSPNTLELASTTIHALMMDAATTASTVQMAGRTLVVNGDSTASANVAMSATAKSLTFGSAANEGFVTAGSTGNSTLNLVNANSDAASLLTVNAVIRNNAGSGAVAVVTGGDGKVVLTGDNTYTGATTVTAGSTLQVGAGGTSGTLGTGTAGVTNKGTLIFNRSDSFSFGKVISDVGDLTKTGAGVMSLTAANTYTGVTTISGGTLQVGAGGSTGSLGSGLVVNNGVLSINLTSNYTMDNYVSGTGSLVKKGTNTLGLYGNNSYSGGTTIEGGIVRISGYDNAFGSGAISVTGDASINNNASDITRALANNIAISSGKTLSLDGGFGPIRLNGVVSGAGNLSKASSGTVILAGNNTYTGTTTVSGSSGGLQVGAGGTTGTLGTGNVTVNSTGTLYFNRSNTYTVANVISGLGGKLNQMGSGTTILSAANTYTGGTTVDAGKLLLNGTNTFSAGAMTVNSGGTLGGIGKYTTTGATTVNSGGTLQGGDGTVGTTLTITNSAVTLASGSIIQLALGASFTHSTLAHTNTSGTNGFTFASDQKFTFFDLGAVAGTYDNLITGLTASTVTSGWTITNSGWLGTFSYDGANIDLVLTAVPEPSTYGLIGAGALAAVAMVRRRRRRQQASVVW